MTVYDKPQPKSDALDHIRIAVALIPTEPLFSNIIEASQAITRQFQNFNIIDNSKIKYYLVTFLFSFRSCSIACNFPSVSG